MKNNKSFLYIFIFLAVVIVTGLFASGFRTTVVINPTNSTKVINLTGTIVQNVTIIAGNASNVTFRWTNSTGKTRLNITILNSTNIGKANRTVFNKTLATTTLPDGLYNLTINAYNRTANTN